MAKSLIKAAIVGGIIVFVWGMFSWMVLPWHIGCMHRFEHQGKVAQVIMDNAPVDGMYVIPNMHVFKQGLDKEEMDKKIKREQERLMQGPIIHATVHREGIDPHSMMPFAGTLIIQIVAGFFIAGLLAHTKPMSYMKKVGFITIVGLIAGILGLIPGWNWYFLSTGFVIVGTLDLVIGWFLAGLAMAKIVKTK